MPKFEPRDPDFEARVRNSFSRQTAMHTLGAVLGRVNPGEVEIEMPYRTDLSQQHGFIHGGITTAILDSACGYAAFSLSAPDTAVLTVEYKVNFIAPAKESGLWPGGRCCGPAPTLPFAKGTWWPLKTAKRSW